MISLITQGAHRTPKVVFYDFPGPFYVRFQDFPGPFMSIFHVFPGLFNQADIKQVRFSYTCTKSITLCRQLNLYRGVQPKCGVKTAKCRVQN